jgi:hypothetical protein
MSGQSTDTLEIRFTGSGNWAQLLRRWFHPQEPRAQKRDQAIDDAQRIGDIRWQWRQACEVTGLGRLTFTPSGPVMTIPMLGRVRLGPPTTFTVRPQPGQLISDFEAAGPRIAAAMGASGIRVAHLAAEWLVIELLGAPAQQRSGDAPKVVPFTPRTGSDRAPDYPSAA